MATVPTRREGQSDPNQEGRDAEVRVGTTVPDDQLRQMMGSFGDLDEEDGNPDSRPDEVALNKTRTWG